MNTIADVKMNPSPAVIDETTARKLTPSTSPSFSFPIPANSTGLRRLDSGAFATLTSS